jgi:hypothetical protein
MFTASSSDKRGSRPAYGGNGGVAVVEPEHHRREVEALGPEALGDVIDEFGERQDTVAADQALRLDGEGDEGREIDEARAPQEQVGDELVARRLRSFLAPQEQD